MHDILIKNDCDGLFSGLHYISVNRNNKSLFAMALCTRWSMQATFLQ